MGRLWEHLDAMLPSSGCALEEARRNLETDARKRRLTRRFEDLEVIAEARPTPLEELDSPEKIRPILRAALRSDATHLITGDLAHFGPYWGE